MYMYMYNTHVQPCTAIFWHTVYHTVYGALLNNEWFTCVMGLMVNFLSVLVSFASYILSKSVQHNTRDYSPNIHTGCTKMRIEITRLRERIQLHITLYMQS